MYLRKTEKASLALTARDRGLSLKNRAMLLLADGRKTDTELLNLVQAEPEALDALTVDGYLERMRSGARTAHRSADRPADPPPPQTAPTPSPVRVSADGFEGKRSLATSRMFLFDLTERMFARRDPALARSLRERFREARDREAMLDVARELLGHIEQQAGSGRADEISARLAMLLPDEVVSSD